MSADSAPPPQSSLPQGSSEVPQLVLKRRMSEEISNQVWQFPPGRIAEMLCPSGIELPLGNAAVSLSKELCSKPDLASIPSTSGERQTTYPGVAFILNSCIEACVEVILKSGRNSVPRWFDDFRFIVWDKEMSDGVDGVEKLRPDLAGLNNSPPSRTGINLYWNILQEDDTKRRLLLPVEINGADADMVRQAATYARGLNSAVPFRAFELVLGYNYLSDHFRFLIFHRGGLTCSTPINLRSATQKNNCTDLVRMFMPILSWTKADDAGCPSFSNGKQLLLPRPLHPTTLTRFTTDVVLYQKPGVRSRNTWVARLKPHVGDASHAAETADLSSGEPSNVNAQSSHPEPSQSNPPRKGTSKLVSVFKSTRSSMKRKQLDETLDPVRTYYSESYEPLHFAWKNLAIAEPEATEQPSSVILKASWQVEQRKTIEADVFTKLDGAFGTAKYWYCAQPLDTGGSKPASNIAFLPNDEEIDSCFWDVLSKEPPKAAERRYLVLTLLATEGKQCTHAKTAEDLVDYFTHSVLGWWSVYQAGFLHRDVSIGNILMIEEPFECKRAFSIDVEELLRNTASKSSEAAPTLGRSDPLADKRGELTRRIRRDAESIKELILRNGLSEKHARAFIMDFDVSASWVGYFDNTDHSAGSISGTLPFMSDKSADALTMGQPFVQSPVDDIESFFWVLLYSIVRNSTSPPSHFHNRLRNTFDVASRGTVLRRFKDIWTEEEYGKLAYTLSDFRLLSTYDNANSALRAQWVKDCKALPVGDAMLRVTHVWELCYHAAAISGLLMVLQILVDVKAKIMKQPSNSTM